MPSPPEAAAFVRDADLSARIHLEGVLGASAVEGFEPSVIAIGGDFLDDASVAEAEGCGASDFGSILHKANRHAMSMRLPAPAERSGGARFARRQPSFVALGVRLEAGGGRLM